MNLPEFSRYAPARLIEVTPAGEEQALLEVQAPPGFVAAHTSPGQFCKMRLGGAEGIFAMLSAPGEAPRFLVRVGNPEGGEAADALASARPGTEIEMTLPAGRGFALDRAVGRDVRFVATGTGVAPIRAAIEHVLARRHEYGALSLDYGLKTAGHLALRDDVERWRGLGVEVRVVYSRPGPSGALVGTTVQESLRRHCPDLSRAAVVAVGQAAMLSSLREVVRDRGGDPEALITNV